MSKAIFVTDMPESCSKCKFMYEFYGVKKCQLLNILVNGGKAIITQEKLTTERKDVCPLKEVPEKKDILEHSGYLYKDLSVAFAEGYNACIDEILEESKHDGE